MDNFTLKTFQLGGWMTNSYFLGWEESKEAWIIDPGFSPEPLVEFIKEGEWNVTKILLTHAHLDHIAGNEAIVKLFPNVEILIHQDEKDFLTDPSLNLASMSGMEINSPDPTGTFLGGDFYILGDLKFNVLHTPGHSPGGASFYQKDLGLCFTGDALFERSVGRTDFPTSDGPRLIQAIKEKLFTLPGETQVLPGHGPTTTIEFEKKSNPFIQ